MGKFKVNKFEVDGKEYEVKDIQDVIPNLVDSSELKGGVGNPFRLDKVKGVKTMISCWLIEFKDGYKIIISESLYKEEVERNFKSREVLCESHWFDFEVCRKRNQGVSIFGFTS